MSFAKAQIKRFNDTDAKGVTPGPGAYVVEKARPLSNLHAGSHPSSAPPSKDASLRLSTSRDSSKLQKSTTSSPKAGDMSLSTKSSDGAESACDYEGQIQRLKLTIEQLNIEKDHMVKDFEAIEKVLETVNMAQLHANRECQNHSRDAEIAEVKEELYDALERVERHKEEVMLLKKTLDKADAEKSSLAAELGRKYQEAEEVQQSLDERVATMNEQSKEIACLQASVHSLNDLIRKLEQLLEEKEDESNSAERELKETRNALTQKNAEMDELKKTIFELSAKNSAFDDELTQKARHIDELQLKLNNVDVEYESLKRDFEILHSNWNSLNEFKNDKELYEAQIHAEMNASKANLDDARAQNAKLTNEKETIENYLKSERNAFHQQQDQLRANYKTVHDELTSLQGKFNEAKELIKLQESKIDGLVALNTQLSKKLSNQNSADAELYIMRNEKDGLLKQLEAQERDHQRQLSDVDKKRQEAESRCMEIENEFSQRMLTEQERYQQVTSEYSRRLVTVQATLAELKGEHQKLLDEKRKLRESRENPTAEAQRSTQLDGHEGRAPPPVHGKSTHDGHNAGKAAPMTALVTEENVKLKQRLHKALEEVEKLKKIPKENILRRPLTSRDNVNVNVK